jgi:cell shape-determining protein MreD
LILLVLLGWVLHARVEGKWYWGLIAGFLFGIASALPLWLPIVAYLLVTALANLLQTRVWQVPIMSLYVTTIAGTFIVQGISFFYLVVTGTPLSFNESLNLIILPSVILNSLLALPVYAVIGEVANWLYPPELES